VLNSTIDLTSFQKMMSLAGLNKKIFHTKSNCEVLVLNGVDFNLFDNQMSILYMSLVIL